MNYQSKSSSSSTMNSGARHLFIMLSMFIMSTFMFASANPLFGFGNDPNAIRLHGLAGKYSVKRMLPGFKGLKSGETVNFDFSVDKAKDGDKLAENIGSIKIALERSYSHYLVLSKNERYFFTVENVVRSEKNPKLFSVTAKVPYVPKSRSFKIKIYLDDDKPMLSSGETSRFIFWRSRKVYVSADKDIKAERKFEDMPVAAAPSPDANSKANAEEAQTEAKEASAQSTGEAAAASSSSNPTTDSKAPSA